MSMTRATASVVEVFVELDFDGFEKLRLLGKEFFVGIVGSESIECLAGLVEAGELTLPDKRVAGLAAGDRLHAFALREIRTRMLESSEAAFEFEKFFFLTDIELLEDAHGDGHDDGGMWLLEKLEHSGRQCKPVTLGKFAQRVAIDVGVDRVGAGDRHRSGENADPLGIGERKP